MLNHAAGCQHCREFTSVFSHHRHGWKWKRCVWYQLWGHKGSFVIPAASRVRAALLGEGRRHLWEAARLLPPVSPALSCSSVLCRDKSCVGQPVHLTLGNRSLQAELGWKRQCHSFPEDARAVWREEGIRIQPNEVVVHFSFHKDQWPWLSGVLLHRHNPW